MPFAKKSFKNFMAALLTFVLVLSIAPISVFASTNIKDIVLELEDGTFICFDLGALQDSSAGIPDTTMYDAYIEAQMNDARVAAYIFEGGEFIDALAANAAYSNALAGGGSPTEALQEVAAVVADPATHGFTEAVSIYRVDENGVVEDVASVISNGDGTGSDKNESEFKVALVAAINAAEAVVNGAQTSANDDGAEFPPTEIWYHSDDIAVLQTAITSAKATLNNAESTDEDFETATTGLNAAVTAFENAGRPGTETGGATVVTNVEITGGKTFKVTFSDEVDIVLNDNFVVTQQGEGTNLSIASNVVSTDKTSVTVTLTNSFVSGNTYLIKVTGVVDGEGDTVPDFTKTIEYVIGAPAKIEFITSVLPEGTLTKAKLDNAVEVTDENGNVIDHTAPNPGFTITYNSSPAIGSSEAASLSSGARVTVDATISASVKTGVSILTVEAAQIAEVTDIIMEIDGVEVESLFADGSGRKADDNVELSDDSKVSFTAEGIDQFGGEVAASATGLTFSSSNPAVLGLAANGEGVVLGKGTVTVTATSSYNGASKAITLDIEDAPGAVSFEVDTKVTVVGDSTAPRIPITFAAVDQYGINVGATIKYTNVSASTAELYENATGGAAKTSGTNIDIDASGKHLFYVQGKATGTAILEFVLELENGDTYLLECVVTSIPVGEFGGYKVEASGSIIDRLDPTSKVEIKVYEINKQEVPIKDISTALATTYEITGTSIKVGSSKNIFVANAGIGKSTVTVKIGSYESETVEIEVKDVVKQIKSVSFNNSTITMGSNLSDILAYDMDALLDNMVVVYTDGTRAADATEKRKIISTMFSDNSNIVSFSANTAGPVANIVTNITDDSEAYIALSAGSDKNSVHIEAGKATVTVSFKNNAFANQTFAVVVPPSITIDDGALNVDTFTVNSAAGDRVTGHTVSALTIGKGTTLTLSSTDKIAGKADSKITINGTLVNNGTITVPATGSSADFTIAGSATGSPGVISGGTQGEPGVIVAGANSAMLSLEDNLKIASGAYQKFAGGTNGSDALTVTLEDAAVMTNEGTMTIKGGDNGTSDDATFILDKTAAFNNAHILNIEGHDTVASVVKLTIGATSGEAVFTNREGATLNITGGAYGGAATAELEVIASYGKLVNNGTINVEGGANADADATITHSRVGTDKFINNNTINLTNGASGDAILDIAGSATVVNNGTITNAGTIKAATEGIISISGENGKLVVVADAGELHDRAAKVISSAGADTTISAQTGKTATITEGSSTLTVVNAKVSLATNTDAVLTVATGKSLVLKDTEVLVLGNKILDISGGAGVTLTGPSGEALTLTGTDENTVTLGAGGAQAVAVPDDVILTVATGKTLVAHAANGAVKVTKSSTSGKIKLENSAALTIGAATLQAGTNGTISIIADTSATQAKQVASSVTADTITMGDADVVFTVKTNENITVVVTAAGNGFAGPGGDNAAITSAATQ